MPRTDFVNDLGKKGSPLEKLKPRRWRACTIVAIGKNLDYNITLDVADSRRRSRRDFGKSSRFRIVTKSNCDFGFPRGALRRKVTELTARSGPGPLPHEASAAGGDVLGRRGRAIGGQDAERAFS